MQVFEAGRKTWRTRDENQEEAKREFVKILNRLEDELGEKPFFGGETVGFVDICLVPHYCYFHTYEILSGLSIEKERPKYMAWVKRCLQKGSISKTLPDRKNALGLQTKTRRRRRREFLYFRVSFNFYSPNPIRLLHNLNMGGFAI
ncbi:hypothetical protein Patl1_12325 [Pistacia atlantica]|uniref:Uncharacterized protein n=1 Tax=Pistacia atlantica TaxID=434234 RepID=A0ACC1A4L8_9ROSI|nr:hypothetical protein Patl1_12325 [Pistacia atlantica]